MLSPNGYEAMKVSNLREELRKRGLDIQGAKADLISRLVSADTEKLPKRPRMSVDTEDTHQHNDYAMADLSSLRSLLRKCFLSTAQYAFWF